MSKQPKPRINATHLTLGLARFSDVIEKLRWEIVEFKRRTDEQVAFVSPSGSTDARAPLWIAVNAASTAWSLVEWAYHEVEADDLRVKQFADLVGVTGSPTLYNIKEATRRIAEIDFCHQIAHAAKHAKLGEPRQGLNTEITFDVYESKERLAVIARGEIVQVDGDCTYRATIYGVLLDAERWWTHAATVLGIPIGVWSPVTAESGDSISS